MTETNVFRAIAVEMYKPKEIETFLKGLFRDIERIFSNNEIDANLVKSFGKTIYSSWVAFSRQLGTAIYEEWLESDEESYFLDEEARIRVDVEKTEDGAWGIYVGKDGDGSHRMIYEEKMMKGTGFEFLQILTDIYDPIPREWKREQFKEVLAEIGNKISMILVSLGSTKPVVLGERVFSNQREG